MPPGYPVPREHVELAAGALIGGRYRVSRPLASGGFGTVYEATHVHTRRVVALKVLHERVALDETARERFRREVSAPARIGHPGIVMVYDADAADDGTLFVAMELLAGEPLRALFERADLHVDAALELFDALLDPLAAAHAAGFVHRDLKPENVFVLPSESGAWQLRILDFGLARRQGSVSVTATGQSLGTPRYMSPEQYMNAKAAGPSTDVWAVGVMLYEVLSGGRPPFAAKSQHALTLKVLTEPHAPLDERAPVPTALARLVDRCLQKEPTDRPADAAALRRELADVRRSLGIDEAATVREMPRREVPHVEVPHVEVPHVEVPHVEAPPSAPRAASREPGRPDSGPLPYAGPSDEAPSTQADVPGARAIDFGAPPRRPAISWMVSVGVLSALALALAAAGLAWAMSDTGPRPSGRARRAPPSPSSTLPAPMAPVPHPAPMLPVPEEEAPSAPATEPTSAPEPTARRAPARPLAADRADDDDLEPDDEAPDEDEPQDQGWAFPRFPF